MSLEQEYDVRLINTRGIASLLKFLPYFETSKKFGKPATCVRGTVGCSVLSDQAEAFYQACYRHHFVQPFDWMAWERRHERLVEGGEGIETLDIESIGRLLTTYIRGDRFCDGLLLHVMNAGFITRILRRLQNFQAGDTENS